MPRLYADQPSRKILLERKTGREMDSSGEGQLLNYLPAAAIEVGRLFNFGLQAQCRRYVVENNNQNAPESASICGKEVTP